MRIRRIYDFNLGITNMSFDVRRTSADNLSVWMGEFFNRAISELESVAISGVALSQVDGFSGETADALALYWQNTHLPILKTMCSAIYELYARYGEYIIALEEVDAGRDARFEEEALFRSETELGSCIPEVISMAQQLERIISEISDIMSLGIPSNDALTNRLFELSDVPKSCRNRIEGIEDFYSQSFACLDEIIAVLERTLTSFAPITAFTYDSYSKARDSIDLMALENASSTSQSYFANKVATLKDPYDGAVSRINDRIHDALSAQRADQGTAKALEGAIDVITGLVCIGVTAATGGATLPAITFLAPSITFGTASTIEGIQDTIYGGNKDLETSAFNPIRDTIFFGNEFLYEGGSLAADFLALAGPSAKTAFGSIKGLTGRAALRGFGEVFIKDYVKVKTKNAIIDSITDTSMSFLLDPQIDTLFGDTETGAEIKKGLRDLTGEVISTGVG